MLFPQLLSFLLHPHPKKGLPFEGYGNTHPAESQESTCVWTKRVSSMECDGSDQRWICHTSECMCSCRYSRLTLFLAYSLGGRGGGPELGCKTESYLFAEQKFGVKFVMGSGAGCLSPGSCFLTFHVHAIDAHLLPAS